MCHLQNLFSLFILRCRYLKICVLKTNSLIKHYVNSVSVFEVDYKNLRIGNFLVFYALIVIVYVC